MEHTDGVSGENAAARDVAIVTSKSNRVQVMKAADLTKVIKTTHKWLDGSDLTVALTDPSSPEMRVVAEAVNSSRFRARCKCAQATTFSHTIVWW